MRVPQKCREQYWGWAQKSSATAARGDLPARTRVHRSLRSILVPHWSHLEAMHVEGPVTTPVRTLVDCMRNLPLDESLPIVNSAIRADDFTADEVREIADATQGAVEPDRKRSPRRRLVGRPTRSRTCSTPRRCSVPGLQVEPQLAVAFRVGGSHCTPTWVIRSAALALEAEGFEWHGSRAN